MIWNDKTLKEKGYDGLYYPGACACEIGDLRPCGSTIEDTLECKPGYRRGGDRDAKFYIIGAKLIGCSTYGDETTP
jgi:hypothetical protein